MAEQFLPVGVDQRLFMRYSPVAADIHDHKDTPLVIMAHDFPGGHMQGTGHLFEDLEKQLNHDGYSTLRFDFRGAGGSSGAPEHFTLTTAYQDFQTVLGWVWKQGYERYVFIGEGIGASVCLMNMSARVSGLIMFWPMLDFRKTHFKTYLPQIEHPSAKGRKTVTVDNIQVGTAFIKELMGTSLVADIKKLRAPVLVQHGDADKKSPIEQLALLREYATFARRVDITSYGGGAAGLTKKSERETLMRNVGAFLNKYT